MNLYLIKNELLTLEIEASERHFELRNNEF